MSAAWSMLIETEGEPAREVSVAADGTVGRHPDNSVVLQDPRVSGFHFRFVRDDAGTFHVEDRGSSNGTQVVDGELLRGEQRTPIRAGLRLRLGRTRVTFRTAGSIEATILGGTSVASAIEKMAKPATASPEPAAEPAPAPKEATPAPTAPPPAKPQEKAPPQTKPAEPVVSKETAPPEPKAPDAEAKGAEEPPKADAPKPVAKKPKPKAEVKDVPPAPEEEVDENEITHPTPPRSRGPTPSNPTVALEAMSGGLAGVAEFRTAMARLVIATESLKQRYDLTMIDVTVGRSRSTELPVDLRLEHDAVSSHHARLRFDRGRFFLEDLNSRNGTYIEEERLSPGSPREIHGNRAVRFGTVTALFITEVDEKGAPVDRKLYDDALSILEGEGTINGLVVKRVRSDVATTKAHPGEMLILEGRITPDQWSDAVRRAPFLKVARHQAARVWGGPRFLLLAAAIVVIAGTLVYLLSR
jgi:pSer/pThr/pTyr-binding forkhead associated (FHA) protein